MTDKATEYHPKQYFNNNRCLEWRKDLTPEQMDALRGGEIFVLLNRDGKPYSTVLMDSYNQIRESRIYLPE